MKNYWLVAVTLLALLLAGCGGGSETDPGAAGAAEGTQAADTKPGLDLDRRSANRVATMWVEMDGWDTAETVSFLMAENGGYFGKVNISPLNLSPRTPEEAIPDVVEGQDVLGVTSAPEAIVARDKGEPVAIVGSVLEEATAALIWTKKSGLEGIADLKGKTVAIPGLSSQKILLENVLTEEGVDPAEVKVIKVGNDLVPSLIKGKADAIFGGSPNVEGIDLKSRGFQPVVTPVTSLGVPDYDELVLIARQDLAEANPKLMGDYVSAVARGAAAAKQNPQKAVELLAASGEKNPEVSPAATHQQVGMTNGMLSSSGQVDPERLQRLIDWMSENEMIKQDLTADELLAR
jgi:putative hydroxymethylpyrimidine transport system substrate-binding protein